MGSINCCHNQSYKFEEFRQHCQTFASPDYLSYFASIQQKQDINEGTQLKTQHKQYIQGSWNNDKIKTGKGVIFAPQRFYYEGQIVEGWAKGQGKIIWPNKFLYKGTIDNNKASGYGELFLGEKSISLKGDWVRGLPKLNTKMQLNKEGRHGSITFVDQSGSQQEQDFFKDTLNVKVQLGNGVCYEGEVKQKNNVYKIEGKGTMKYPDDSYYVGTFSEGMMHGHGKYYWSNTGNWFEGEYKANFRDGRGTYYFNNQQYERGEWRGGILLKEEPTVLQNKPQIQHFGGSELKQIYQTHQ